MFQIQSASVQTNSGGVILTHAGSSSGAPAIYQTYINGSGNPAIERFLVHTNSGQQSTEDGNSGDVFTPVHFLPQMSTLHYIDVYLYRGATSGSTTAGTIKVYTNGNPTEIKSKTVTRADVAKGYVRIELNKAYTNSFQLEFEFENNDIRNNTMAPGFAVVDYEPTDGKG